MTEPSDETQDTWLMSDVQKQGSVPRLRADGNGLFAEGRFEDAALRYGEALTLLEQLQLKEKPLDEEWMLLFLQVRNTQTSFKERQRYANCTYTDILYTLSFFIIGLSSIHLFAYILRVCLH